MKNKLEYQYFIITNKLNSVMPFGLKGRTCGNSELLESSFCRKIKVPSGQFYLNEEHAQKDLQKYHADLDSSFFVRKLKIIEE